MSFYRFNHFLLTNPRLKLEIFTYWITNITFDLKFYNESHGVHNDNFLFFSFNAIVIPSWKFKSYWSCPLFNSRLPQKRFSYKERGRHWVLMKKIPLFFLTLFSLLVPSSNPFKPYILHHIRVPFLYHTNKTGGSSTYVPGSIYVLLFTNNCKALVGNKRIFYM